jgi:glucose/arabinose dehydrogenase
MRLFRSFLLPLLILIGCTANGEGDGETATSAAAQGARPFAVEDLGRFEEPWAMVFLPGGNQALITERRGRLLLWGRQDQASAVTAVAGVPSVDYGGQGGLGDVVLHPDFANNRLVYLSWIEAGQGGRGAVVGRARLVAEGAPPRLEGMQVIWRQQPKLSGRGHYAHRLAFSPDGRHLFITSGDRQEFTPAQDLRGNLGKIVRLNADGSVPADNPFADRGGVAAQVWTLGHRNPLGIAFDLSGRLWAIEMGPAGGDELNLIERGRNYGYPIVSDGDHYDGRPIPDHDTRPEFEAPAVTWTPVISPGNMIVYSGSLFPQWRGDILAAALSGQAVVRVDLNGAGAREAERFAMGERIREIEQHPDGSIYLLQDMKDGKGGRLLRLTPAR